jgi:glucose-1-phosphate cytidylyltransferase|tara:strand:- start:2098 stop:2913 length:816 start_codon:yes stop_codon:yes gene_type:complete
MKGNIEFVHNNDYRTAVILCGGKGTRLGNLSKKIPKALVRIQGQSILWYTINILKYYNFNHFILPVGYKGNLIKKFLKKNKNFQTNIDLIDTGIDTNIGKRILKVEKKIKSKNFLLLNGDAIFDFNLNKIFESHEKNKIGITFLAGEIIYQYGTVGILNNKVIDFKRNIVYNAVKTKKSPNYTAYNYIGMSVIKSDFLKKYKKIYKNSENFELSFFQKIIKNFKSKIVKIDGMLNSVDNMKDIDYLNKKNLTDNRYNYIKGIKKKILKKFY